MIEHYYRELLSYFSRRASNADNAADIVQEAYSRVIAAQQAGSAIAQPRALLYRTARNIMIDLHRRALSHGEHVNLDDETSGCTQEQLQWQASAEASDPETRLASTQAMQAVLLAIDQLPVRRREAFVLHKFDGLSQAEVARRLGISVKAVEQHIRQAMLACRKAQAADSMGTRR